MVEIKQNCKALHRSSLTNALSNRGYKSLKAVLLLLFNTHSVKKYYKSSHCPPPPSCISLGGAKWLLYKLHVGTCRPKQDRRNSQQSKMVAWTDFERATIKDIFSKIDYEVVGPAAISRCLIVYPWTQRYFAGFGNLYNAAAITSNPKVANNIKATFTELSTLHSEKLQVDPDNFMLLGDCLAIVVAAQLGKDFTPEVHAAFQKFLAVVVSSLRRQYY
uniref:Globin domain-containing protein n=1 Tax=Haplochromis burtoni TaxID=8153 RepID=A0A3Q2XE85_HAPBU